MSTLPNDHPDHLELPAPASPADLADQLVIHGLLAATTAEAMATRRSRIDRVLLAAATPRPSPLQSISVRPFTRWAMATAAALAIAVTLVILGLPGESKALATIRESIEAMRTAGTRRYEVRIFTVNDDDSARAPIATVDVRSPGLLVIKDRPPWFDGDKFVGRDASGAWTVLPDGAVLRDPPIAYWPPWASVGGQPLFTDSIQSLIAGLPNAYALGMLDAQPLPSKSFGTMDRVRGLRINKHGHEPDRVELWIDPLSRMVERVEYHWTAAAPQEPTASTKTAPPAKSHVPGSTPPPPPGGPPRLVVFERVDTPELPQDWFTPEGHRPK